MADTKTCEDYGKNIITITSLTSGANIIFGAFITDFSDEYKSNWNTQEIYGRMDPVYTYKNTIRKISLGFDVPAGNLESAKSNVASISSLIRGLYPMYQEHPGAAGGAVISSPPLFKIKFKNLIKSITNQASLLGWIDGYSYKPDIEKGFFADDENIYPKLFKVSFNFNVIHDHPLGWKAEKVDGNRVQRHGITGFPYGLGEPAAPVTQNTQNTTPQTSANTRNGNVPSSTGTK